MYRKRPFAIHRQKRLRHPPTCVVSRVVFMSCRRLAKKHGTEMSRVLKDSRLSIDIVGLLHDPCQKVF